MNRSHVRHIRALIRASGLSQNKFARAHGFSSTHFSQLLAGIRRPSLTVALKFEAFFKVPVSAWPNLRDTVEHLPQLGRAKPKQPARRPHVADSNPELVGAERR